MRIIRFMSGGQVYTGRQVDEHTARKPVPREDADLTALVEAVLEHYVRLELDCARFVDFPPEVFVALDAGGVAGLGKAVRHG